MLQIVGDGKPRSALPSRIAAEKRRVPTFIQTAKSFVKNRLATRLNRVSRRFSVISCASPRNCDGTDDLSDWKTCHLALWDV